MSRLSGAKGHGAVFNGFELPDHRLKRFHARALAFETLWNIQVPAVVPDAA